MTAQALRKSEHPITSDLRSYIFKLRARMGKSLSALAKEGGVAHTTMQRWIEEPPKKAIMPHRDTLASFLAAHETSGIPIPDSIREYLARPGSEAVNDALLLVDGEAERFAAIAAAFVRHEGTGAIYRVTSRALELSGILPGDLLVTEPAARLEVGRPVLASVESGSSRIVLLRLFQPPHLVAHSLDARRAAPEYLDGKRVLIVAPVIAAVRPYDA